MSGAGKNSKMTTQSFDTERDLTPDEILERNKLRDDLDEERDALLVAVEDRRKEIRGFNVARKKVEMQLRDVQRELRTGKVFESPQTTLVFDGPDAHLERRDRGIEPDRKFPEPAPRHGEGELLDPVALRHLITCVRPRGFWPTVREVEGWHEQVRADVQRWCGVEHTRANPIAGLPLPDSFGMPYVLSKIEFEREDKRKQRQGVGERKATARKAPAKRGRKASAPRGLRL